MFKKMIKKIVDFFNPPKIKGNITTLGRKIYHIPGGRFYETTQAEVMFKTEEEAIAAGFKKSKQ